VSDVRPFRALRYDPERVDLSRVVVPPYDVVRPEQRAALYARDPHCAIRLELTERVEDEAGTDYAHVAALLREWTREGVLVRDPRPALYGLRQRFRAPDGVERVREGFFGALRLERYQARVVLPHERTLSGPKADRLKQLRATATNLSPVFFLYEDREQSLAAVLAKGFDGPPLGRALADDGVEHALWRFDDPGLCDAVARFLRDRPVVIADGHHRYETALAYRDERRAADPDAGPEASGERLLGYFANAFAPGSLLLPIHRIVRRGPAPTDAEWRARLAGFEERRVALGDPAELPALLASELAPLRDAHAFAADDGSGTLRIFRRAGDGELTVRMLEREVLGPVFGVDADAIRDGALAYASDPAHAAREVRAGRGAVALYLNPLSPDDVFRVTGRGEVLPQKSTFFVPKLPSGLVFRPHGEPA